MHEQEIKEAALHLKRYRQFIDAGEWELARREWSGTPDGREGVAGILSQMDFVIGHLPAMIAAGQFEAVQRALVSVRQDLPGYREAELNDFDRQIEAPFNRLLAIEQLVGRQRYDQALDELARFRDAGAWEIENFDARVSRIQTLAVAAAPPVASPVERLLGTPLPAPAAPVRTSHRRRRRLAFFTVAWLSVFAGTLLFVWQLLVVDSPTVIVSPLPSPATDVQTADIEAINGSTPSIDERLPLEPPLPNTTHPAPPTARDVPERSPTVASREPRLAIAPLPVTPEIVAPKPAPREIVIPKPAPPEIVIPKPALVAALPEAPLAAALPEFPPTMETAFGKSPALVFPPPVDALPVEPIVHIKMFVAKQDGVRFNVSAGDWAVGGWDQTGERLSLQASPADALIELRMDEDRLAMHCQGPAVIVVDQSPPADAASISPLRGYIIVATERGAISENDLRRLASLTRYREAEEFKSQVIAEYLFIFNHVPQTLYVELAHIWLTSHITLLDKAYAAGVLRDGESRRTVGERLETIAAEIVQGEG